MLLDTANGIRSMNAAERSRSEIARVLHGSRNTVAKYADMEDMSRVSPARHGQGEAALPGLRRRIREAVGGNHHETGIQQVRVVIRGRPDGRRRDRPHRPPQEAHPVTRRAPARPPCPHTGGLADQ